MKYPYPIKNWRNADEYENIESFAWEFLRRNINYQKDFDNLTPLGEWGWGYKYGLLHPYLPHPKEGFNSECVIFNCDQLLDVWRFDTDSSIDPFIYDFNNLKPSDPTQVVIAFDVSSKAGLELQLKAAKDLLLSESAKHGVDSSFTLSPVSNNNLLIKYLRVLDGDASGAELLDMCSVLESHKPNDCDSSYLANKTIRNSRVAGLKLAESGYMSIAYKEEKRSKIPFGKTS